MRRRSMTSTTPALFATATSAPQPECIRTPIAARFMSEVCLRCTTARSYPIAEDLRPHLLAKLLLELLQLGSNYKLAIRLSRVVVVILLVIVLADVELFCRLHARDNRLRKRFGRVQRRDRLLRLGLLLLRRVEDHRPVLLSHIVSLPVQSRRIVYRKKHLEQIPVLDLARIKRDLHYFHVPCVPVAHLPVRGIVHMPTHIPGHRRFHTLQPVEHSLDTPKASAPENCDLFVRHAHWMPNSPRSSTPSLEFDRHHFARSLTCLPIVHRCVLIRPSAREGICADHQDVFRIAHMQLQRSPCRRQAQHCSRHRPTIYACDLPLHESWRCLRRQRHCPDLPVLGRLDLSLLVRRMFRFHPHVSARGDRFSGVDRLFHLLRFFQHLPGSARQDRLGRTLQSLQQRDCLGRLLVVHVHLREIEDIHVIARTERHRLPHHRHSSFGISPVSAGERQK